MSFEWYQTLDLSFFTISHKRLKLVVFKREGKAGRHRTSTINASVALHKSEWVLRPTSTINVISTRLLDFPYYNKNYLCKSGFCLYQFKAFMLNRHFYSPMKSKSNSEIPFTMTMVASGQWPCPVFFYFHGI